MEACSRTWVSGTQSFFFFGLRTSVALRFRVAKPDFALFASDDAIVFELDWVLVDLVDWLSSFDFAIVIDYVGVVFFGLYGFQAAAEWLG